MSPHVGARGDDSARTAIRRRAASNSRHDDHGCGPRRRIESTEQGGRGRREGRRDSMRAARASWSGHRRTARARDSGGGGWPSLAPGGTHCTPPAEPFVPASARADRERLCLLRCSNTRAFSRAFSLGLSSMRVDDALALARDRLPPDGVALLAVLAVAFVRRLVRKPCRRTASRRGASGIGGTLRAASHSCSASTALSVLADPCDSQHVYSGR